MTSIELIAIDLDGTLLNDAREISSANIEAIEQAIQADYQIVICTGRTLPGTRRFLQQLPFKVQDEYVILNNGATIHELEDLKVVKRHTLSQEAKQSVFNFSKQFETEDLQLVAVDLDHFYLVEQEQAIPEVVEDADTLATDITYVNEATFLANNGIMKMQIFGKPQILDQVEKEIPGAQLNSVDYVRSQPAISEFLVPGINKAKALKELSNHLGINLENVMAIGDQMNDYEMLQEVGHSVAMGQAVAPIKEIAKYETGTNQESGVAQIIQRLLSQEL